MNVPQEMPDKSPAAQHADIRRLETNLTATQQRLAANEAHIKSLGITLPPPSGPKASRSQTRSTHGVRRWT